jgi:glycosyltransferase involved in cell wall biosynthesis
VREANERLGEKNITLDIYGIVAPDYIDTFEKLKADNADFVSYGGVLDFDKTTETLKDYFAMLFPTYYYGEGFPGNVVDAYNAALPMIATDWNYNNEVIKDGVNGILIPIKDSEALCSAILKLYNDRALALTMAKNNVKEAEKYRPDEVLKVFYEFMDL